MHKLIPIRADPGTQRILSPTSDTIERCRKIMLAVDLFIW